MSWASYGAYLLIVVVLVLVPGPDTFVLLRSSLTGGRRSGLLTTAGVFTGNAVQGSAAAFGLGVLITQSHTLFTILRWAGVAYLCVLAFGALRAARRGDYPSLDGAAPVAGAGKAFGRGFLSNVTNPKILIMYLSVLPQFLVPGVTGTGDALLLALTVAVLGGLWFVGLVLLVHRAREWFSRRRVRRAGDAVSGVALLGFGAALAVD
ncbi:threonine/homoserine/homoserine lactone efflux protein [Pseudonocardia sediminis]|uniref:Threonine/homoserine/homoserine lactone efflux protein n=1 Tax=Pseudonocardia sediminis TaxID=1397368 RepID=A0A4Q7UVT8_PSEST|nr:LysE family translocator [Pseudonocardia sediminis]RZT85926.1 threonine/homoserine/homoserine lactone efflux protein [Pseudonocardia sediminis]